MFRNKSATNSSVLICYVLLLFTWIIAETLVNPIGNFPLNDDWSYAKPVESLTQGRGMQLVNWPAMTLVAQIQWGHLFTTIFGFSFTVLRFSVITLGIIGSFYLFALLMRLNRSRIVSFLLTVLVYFNPLVFHLSNTFMTDVPFLSCIVIALYFLRDAREKDKFLIPLFVSSFFMISAILIRQVGLFLPVALSLAMLLTRDRRKYVFVMVPLAFGIMALSAYEIWIRKTGNSSTTYQPVNNVLSQIFPLTDSIWRYVLRCGGFLYYAGAFFLPLAIITLKKIWSDYSSLQRRWALVIRSIGLIIIIRCFYEVPVGNIMYNFGVGPRLLYDDFVLKINTDTDSSFLLTILFRGAGAVGGMCLLMMIPEFLKRIAGLRRTVFSFNLLLIFNASLYSFLFLIFPSFFDRYYIPLFLFLVLLFAAKVDFSVNSRRAVTIFSFLIVSCSVGFTHDYLEWNRKRWELIDHVKMNLRTKEEAVNGGFEYAGWTFSGGGDDYWFKQWNTRQEYMICFGQIPDYYEIKKAEYTRWIPFGTSEILLLKKR